MRARNPGNSIPRRWGRLALAIAVPLVVVAQSFAWDLEHAEWYGYTEKADAGEGQADMPEIHESGAFAGTQNVYFDFDSATGPGEHLYTLAERDAIVTGVAAVFVPWNFAFSHTAEPVGSHVVLRFNDGQPGGLADDIDFRNLDLSGSATINVNGILGFPATSANVVGLSTTISAHELGHLVGLRHADSFGPIGSGLAPTMPIFKVYDPPYPGPQTATETSGHIMASPASVGQFVAEAIAPTIVGERSAVKLQFNEVGLVTSEVQSTHGTAATAQPLSLRTFAVPNTAVPGDLRYGYNLYADAEAVTAVISANGEPDWYSFSGLAGDIFNAEVISVLPNRFGDFDIDPVIDIFHADGINLLEHGFGAAFNDDEFESFDSALVDIVLPSNGTYYARVGARTTADTGAYELYLYRFRAVPVPEPAAGTLVVLGAFIAAATVRRIR